MGFLGFVVLGLIAGSIAKAILPGRHGGGWITTIVLGVLGALVGGWLGSIIFDTDLGEFFELRTWALAIGGSLVLLVIWGALTGRNKE